MRPTKRTKFPYDIAEEPIMTPDYHEHSVKLKKVLYFLSLRFRTMTYILSLEHQDPIYDRPLLSGALFLRSFRSNYGLSSGWKKVMSDYENMDWYVNVYEERLLDVTYPIHEESEEERFQRQEDEMYEMYEMYSEEKEDYYEEPREKCT